MAGPANTATVLITSQNAVPFGLAHFEFNLLDPHPLLDHNPIPLPNSLAPGSSQQTSHSYPNQLPYKTLHQSARISTIEEHALEAAPAAIATYANNAACSISALTCQGSSLALTKRGPCNPIRSLNLEWELRNHPNKAFVKQLLQDIRQGCSIGYTGPQFTHFAHNLHSAFAHLNMALHRECSIRFWCSGDWTTSRPDNMAKVNKVEKSIYSAEII